VCNQITITGEYSHLDVPLLLEYLLMCICFRKYSYSNSMMRMKVIDIVTIIQHPCLMKTTAVKGTTSWSCAILWEILPYA